MSVLSVAILSKSSMLPTRSLHGVFNIILQNHVSATSEPHKGQSVSRQGRPQLLHSISTPTVNIDKQLKALCIRFCCYLVSTPPRPFIYSSVSLRLKWMSFRRLKKNTFAGYKTDTLETEIKSHLPFLHGIPL